MKFFLAVTCGILCGFIGWEAFTMHIKDAERFANLDRNQASSDILKQVNDEYHGKLTAYNQARSNWQPGQPVPVEPTPPKWTTADDPDLLATADRAIQQSKDISNMSDLSLGIRGGLFASGGLVFGFLCYYIVCLIAIIGAKPLEVALSSIWDNFLRFVLFPFLTVGILGAVVFFAFSYTVSQIILPSPFPRPPTFPQLPHQGVASHE